MPFAIYLRDKQAIDEARQEVQVYFEQQRCDPFSAIAPRTASIWLPSSSSEVARHLSTAAEDMRGYALKVDARWRDLLTPPEECSYIQVPSLLAGQQPLRRPE